MWHKEVLGRVEQRKVECLEQIKQIDALKQSSGISKEQHIERVNLKKVYHSWLRMEEISWRQKSRLVWLKMETTIQNSFTKYANQRHKRNLIKGLMENGV